jgi:hypothetical protein
MYDYYIDSLHCMKEKPRVMILGLWEMMWIASMWREIYLMTLSGMHL